jgi:hypothetical protein
MTNSRGDYAGPPTLPNCCVCILMFSTLVITGHRQHRQRRWLFDTWQNGWSSGRRVRLKVVSIFFPTFLNYLLVADCTVNIIIIR